MMLGNDSSMAGLPRISARGLQIGGAFLLVWALTVAFMFVLDSYIF